MKLEHLLDIHFDLSQPLEIGDGPFGKRVVYNVIGGTFRGERLCGTVLPSGGDWGLFDGEGAARLDVRVTLETDDGAGIYVHYYGIVVPNRKLNEAIEQGGSTDYGDTHFITQPRFETGDERYLWLNRVATAAEGRVVPNAVEYRVFELLHG